MSFERQLVGAARDGDETGMALALAAAASLEPARKARALGHALAEACRYGRAHCTRQLLEAGADPNFLCPLDAQRHWRPLIAAASVGSTACVALLLAAGSDASSRDSSGAVALHHARGVETVRLLLQAAPQAALVRNSSGSTPAQDAALQERCAEAQCLVAEAPLQPAAELLATLKEAMPVVHSSDTCRVQEELHLAALVLAARANLGPAVSTRIGPYFMTTSLLAARRPAAV